MNDTLFNLLCAVFSVILLSNRAFSDESPITIGWIGPLSGNAAVLGVDTVPAIELVFQQVNAKGGISGHAIELLVEDDRYDTAQAQTAYRYLVNQRGVRVVVLLTYGALFSLAEQALKDNVLLLDPLDCDENIAELPKNVLCVSKMSEDLGRSTAEHAVSIDAFPAGVIYFGGDPFMGVVAKASESYFLSKSKRWAFSASYTRETKDFRSLLLRAKQANLKSLFLFGYDEMGLAMRQAREIGVKAQFYALATTANPEFQKLAGDALKDTIIPFWQAPRNARFQEFLKAFLAKVGRNPHFEISTVTAFDIAKLLVAGLQAGALQDGEIAVDALRDYLYSVKDYKGVSGPITIDADGVTRSFSVHLRQYRGGPVAEPLP